MQNLHFIRTLAPYSLLLKSSLNQARITGRNPLQLTFCYLSRQPVLDHGALYKNPTLKHPLS